MKKFLLTAALVLALVTSLTAGTMAFYTAKVDTIEADLFTKEFAISTDQNSDTFKTTIPIAPGDTVVYTIKVNNDGDVDAKTTVAAELSNPHNVPGLFVTVNANSSATTSLSVVALDEVLSDSDVADIAFGESNTYTVTVYWAEGSEWTPAETIAYMTKGISLDIDVSAEQIISNDVFDANTYTGI